MANAKDNLVVGCPITGFVFIPLGTLSSLPKSMAMKRHTPRSVTFGAENPLAVYV